MPGDACQLLQTDGSYTMNPTRSTLLCSALLLIACQADPAAPSGDSMLGAPPTPSWDQSTSGWTKQDITALPFWARGPQCCLDGWGAIFFYADDVVAIPPDFNLLTFFDPRALAAPLAVDGVGFFEIPEAPRLSRLKGLGAVEFWFFPSLVMQAMLADGAVTMSEMRTNDPVVGHARHFREVSTPILGGSPVWRLLAVANGKLTDGGRFNVLWKEFFDPATGEASFSGRIRLREHSGSGV